MQGPVKAVTPGDHVITTQTVVPVAARGLPGEAVNCGPSQASMWKREYEMLWNRQSSLGGYSLYVEISDLQQHAS
eukprot:m.156651 g.156651  ORF g.156651 m.156651 type:complete len:75 (-) comp23632_c0_seq2:68-292(-)